LSEEEYRKKLGRKIRTKEEWERDFPDAEFLKGDEEDDLTKRNLETTSLSSVNWTKYFGAIRDQGGCSSCWTFAVVGVVEGCLGIKRGSPFTALSPQQVLDCDKTGQYGCDGGITIDAMKYVKSKGLMADSGYKYTASQGTCRYSSSKVIGKITGTSYCSNYIRSGSCTASIVNALLMKGPQAVGIDGSNDGFAYYTSGIYSASCSSDDHAVVLVGYGVDSKAGDYWIIRNSWGVSWGMKGYGKIKRNDSNKNSCFVANEAVNVTC